MTLICAWCSQVITRGGDQVSHGICVLCAMDFMARLPRSFLDSVADADGTVTLFSGQKLPLERPTSTERS